MMVAVHLWALFGLLALVPATAQSTLGIGSLENVTIAPPAIAVTDNGDVTVYLSVGKDLYVQRAAPDGTPFGGPVLVVTITELQALQASFQAALASAVAELRANITGVQATVSGVQATVSGVQEAITEGFRATNRTIDTVAAAAAGRSAQIEQSVASLAQATYDNATLAAGATRAQLSSLNSSLVTLVGASVGAATSTLTTAMSTKVDTGNLAVIDGRVQTVVEGMVTPGAVNALNTQLGTKLTSSPTCSCFDPRTQQALSATVAGLSLAANSSQVCSQQGLAFNSATGLCQWTASQPDCGSRITTLDSNAVALCGTTPGSTRLGASCVATCNAGYTGGRTAVFTCNASALWSGALSCPGTISS
jgi:hypothetical protein